MGLLQTVWTQEGPTQTEADLRALATADADLIDELSLEIDGETPAGVDLFDHRQPSPPGLFEMVFPAKNVFGAPAGSVPAVKDGYAVMLEPLSRGQHTIAFGGRFFDPNPDNIFVSSVPQKVR